jgi:hypothetical protein
MNLIEELGQLLDLINYYWHGRIGILLPYQLWSTGEVGKCCSVQQVVPRKVR